MGPEAAYNTVYIYSIPIDAMPKSPPSTEQVVLPPAPLKAQKGRGAVSNMQGRFEVSTREAYDDGWAREEEEAASPFKTQVTDEVAKSILSRNQSPDLPFAVSLNPYRGCEHVIRRAPMCD